MKYFTYIFRNARRNPVRSILTIASTGISLFLMMILLSFFDMRDDAARANRVFNRIITMNANGFAGMVPVSRLREVTEIDGVAAASPFSWYGGKYHDEVMPFAQFAIDPGYRLQGHGRVLGPAGPACRFPGQQGRLRDREEAGQRPRSQGW